MNTSVNNDGGEMFDVLRCHNNVTRLRPTLLSDKDAVAAWQLRGGPFIYVTEMRLRCEMLRLAFLTRLLT
jgi:hypothetical protein